MICQDCGVEADTKRVTFHQNIGALIMRFPKSIEGELCKSCIHKHFWTMTSTTALLGWWGTISFLVTPFMLLNNIGRYVVCLAMPGVPADALPPRLTSEVVDRIKPHMDELFTRLQRGENAKQVATDIADQSQVTPGQVVLFVQAAIDANSK